MSDPIYLTDRSAAEVDDTCGMKFWWNRKEGGIGIVPVEEPLALAIGKQTHADMEALANMADISPGALEEAIGEILAPLTPDDKSQQDKMEILYRRLGWLAAWALFVEPTVRERYDTIDVEGELVLDRDPLWVAATPDRILRKKTDKKLEYWEYKSTITANHKWMSSWMYQIQLHIGLAAASEALKERMSFGQVIGFMKGYTSMSDRRLMHPYVWAWHNTSTGEWEHEYEKARGAKWVPMPIWEYPGGIVQWVAKVGKDVAFMQFPRSSPVFLNEAMLSGWVARRTARERFIAMVEGACREDRFQRAIHFEQRTSKCRPAFGDPCPYLLACWNADVNRDPGKHPSYQPRSPHHMIEEVGIV